MIKAIKISCIIAIIAFVIIVIAGFIKFNILQDDIYIVQKDGSVVRAIDFKEYIFTTENGITGIFAYTSKDDLSATLDINGEFHQLKNVISASGAKYANEDESVIFWSHKGEARIELNGNVYITPKLEKASILAFNIASKRVDCEGVAPMKCLVVNGEYFYSTIEGFEYEEGTEYEITVACTERENVPADASIYTYRLVEIISPVSHDNLTSTSWEWKETQYSNDEIVKSADSTRFVATFSQDERFSSTTDCNNIFGSYSIKNNNLSFGLLASTRKACIHETQERIYSNMISQVTSFFVNEDGNLILELKYDTGSMIFTPQTSTEI